VFKKGLLRAMLGHERNTWKRGRQERHSDKIYNYTVCQIHCYYHIANQEIHTILLKSQITLHNTPAGPSSGSEESHKTVV